jgi:alkylation response protein AidB-like acyl-CoA dehydrogenase
MDRTMNLTEPQAGSDVGALKSRAEPVGDGTYRIFGQKIFITYGEHDMADNIVHFVLARLPDAPAGNARHLAVPGAEIPCQRGWLAGRAQRRLLSLHRAQAGHQLPRRPAR